MRIVAWQKTHALAVLDPAHVHMLSVMRIVILRRSGLSAALEKTELSGLRVYDLRHTFASILLAQGAPITYVAAQLGAQQAHHDASVICPLDSDRV